MFDFFSLVKSKSGKGESGIVDRPSFLNYVTNAVC